MCRNTLFYLFNLDTPTEKHYKLKMDKTGEANKSFESCVEDMMEDRKKKKQITVPAPADDNEKGIDTKAFLMTEMKFGLDFVFRMSDSIFLPFTVRTLWGTAIRWCPCNGRLQRDLLHLGLHIIYGRCHSELNTWHLMRSQSGAGGDL